MIRGCGGGGKHGAAGMDRCEVDSTFERRKLLGGLHAMMSAVPAAADGKICFSGGSEGEERRDQREAEDEQQRDGKKASHPGVGPMLAPEARFKADRGGFTGHVRCAGLLRFGLCKALRWSLRWR